MNNTKTTEKEKNEMEISNPPNKEFKVMVIKMLTVLRRLDKHNEHFNKKTENIGKYQAKS